MHGLVPRVTASIVNTLHERPRLLSVQLKLSNIKSDLKSKLSLCKPMYFNSFLSNVPFLYPLKRSENLWFSELLRRSGGALEGNGLNYIFIGLNVHFNIFTCFFLDICGNPRYIAVSGVTSV